MGPGHVGTSRFVRAGGPLSRHTCQRCWIGTDVFVSTRRPSGRRRVHVSVVGAHDVREVSVEQVDLEGSEVAKWEEFVTE